MRGSMVIRLRPWVMYDARTPSPLPAQGSFFRYSGIPWPTGHTAKLVKLYVRVSLFDGIYVRGNTLLRGAIVNGTYGIHQNLYLVYLTIFTNNISSY